MHQFLCTTLVFMTVAHLTCGQVNGNWGDWGAWGACSDTCGVGTSTRERACDNPAPSGGGANCAGSSQDSMSCTVMNYCIPSVYGNINQLCGLDQFGCATGVMNCVNITQKCDGVADCEDGSDENPYFTDCPNVVCYSGATDVRGSFLMCVLLVLATVFVGLKIHF